MKLQNPKELEILHAVEEVISLNATSTPADIKASIILNRIRGILGLKNLDVAPDMYEALKALVDHFREYEEVWFKSDLCTNAIAAIAKAEGK
jgi:hypothetical protein